MKVFKLLTGLCCIGTIAGCISYVYLKNENIDEIPPVISIESEEIHVGINDPDSVILQGVTVTDNLDGTIKEGAIVERVEKAQDGLYNEFIVTYLAEDSAHNVATAERTLIYDDYHQPQFTLKSPLRFSTDSDGMNIRSSLGVNDCIDGQIAYRMKIDGLESLSSGGVIKAGKYPCLVSVTNSLNDTVSLPITVELYDVDYDESLRPQIKLIDYVVYVKQNESFDDKANIEYLIDLNTMLIDNGETASYIDQNGVEHSVTQATYEGKIGNFINQDELKFTTDADYSVPGIYTGAYTYTSDQTNLVGVAQMYIIVE